MNIKKVFEFKNILFLLLLAIVLNIIGFLLILRIDSFVHVDLYNYGLIFDNDWAKNYWFFKDLLLTFLSGSIIISILSLIPHYDHNTKPTSFSKWASRPDSQIVNIGTTKSLIKTRTIARKRTRTTTVTKRKTTVAAKIYHCANRIA